MRAKHERRWLRGHAVFTLSTCMLLGCAGSSKTTARVSASPPREEEAPRTTAVGNHVKPVMAPFRIPAPGAKLTLIDYFATWCRSSQRWMPKVEALRTKYASAGLVVVGVGHWSEEVVEDLVAFAHTNGATFPIVFDKDHVITNAIPPLSWGQSLVAVDADGIVRLAHLGTSDDDFLEVDAAVGQLLAR